jgi:MFS family permease
MATYFSAGALLIAATVIALATSAVGYLFLDTMPVFVGVWIIFGLTEAMFALALRKIGFDQSAPERQGRVQGQMASALGIGFALGPLLGGFVGKSPSQMDFFLYSVPQFFGLLLFYRRRPPIPENQIREVPNPYGAKELFFYAKRPFSPPASPSASHFYS